MVFFQRLEETKNKELEASNTELKKERETKKQIQTEQLSNKEKELQKSVAACTKAVRFFSPFPHLLPSVTRNTFYRLILAL
jgi:hypothetical protein